MDDVLLFTNVSGKKVTKLKEIMDIYCVVTGMEVNIITSSICFYCLEQDLGNSLRGFNILGRWTLMKPFKYLGFNLKPKHYRS